MDDSDDGLRLTFNSSLFLLCCLLFCSLLLCLYLPPLLPAAPQPPDSPSAASPSTPPGSNAGLVKISGCSISRAGYLDYLSEVFYQRTGIRVLLKGGGSAVGLLNLASSAADLAASCLPPQADDVPQGVRMVPVAWDAIVFIVHSENPLRSITLEQARAIFSGQISNWSRLGGPDRPLTLFLQKAPRSGLQQGVAYFIKHTLLDGEDITDDPTIVSTRPSGGLVEEALLRSPEGVAATGFTSARLKRDRLRILAVDGAEATRENIISGAYPAKLRRHLYLALRPDSPPAAQRFLNFVLSPEGQKLLRDHGAVALDELR